MNNRAKALASRMCGCAAMASLIAGVSAVEAAEEESARISSVLEEVIVTAQKRQERLQDVPISISVVDGERLDRSTVTRLSDALRGVPGVAIAETSVGGGVQITIRGVAPSLPVFGGSSTAGYYLDSIPFGFVRQAIGPDPSGYDLERVEVLRGPQGTLYGVNALNGVVRVLTRDADLNAFALKARTSASNTKDGSEGYRGDVAINVPIIEGKLAARVVGGYQEVGGWIDNPSEKDANDGQLRNMRLKLNAQPTDKLSIGLSAWLSRADYGAPQTANDQGQSIAILDELIASDYDAYGLEIGYEFSGFSLTSTTSYLDYTSRSALHTAPPGGFLFNTVLFPKKFAQELVARSSGEGAWRWTAGGIYSDVSDRYRQTAVVFAAPEDISYGSESYAVFGELTRLFLDGHLELTAGLRYFEDQPTLREYSRTNGAPASQLVFRDDAKFDATTPRLALAYHPNNQTTLYASYSEGFRSGQYQSPTVTIAAPIIPLAEPDRLKNYEVGAKGSLFDGRLGFDSSVYYADWQDVQQRVDILVGGINYVGFVNGDAASGLGVDLGLTFRPTERLELGLSYGWNDLTLDADLFSRGVLLASKGDRLVFSPKYTGSASLDYAVPIGANGFQARFSASASTTSEQISRTIAGNPQARVQTAGDKLVIGRANFSIEAPEHWTVMLFVDNFNNEQGSVTKGANPFSGIRIAPRGIGVQFDYHW